jgi:very-short-patch-repair endonuclease
MYPEAHLRTATKDYKCQGKVSYPCGTRLVAGETYFALTLKSGDRYITRHFCLDCAHRLYPDIIQEALSKMRNEPKIKKAKRKIRDVKFIASKAKTLRIRPTPSEQMLWDRIRNNSLGATFFRQKTLYGYIVDFWCPQKKLIVELDGRHHKNRKERDELRDNTLRSHGITILRFPSALVYHDLRFLLARIREKLKA